MLKNLRLGLAGGLFFACCFSVLALLLYTFRGSGPFAAKGVTLSSTIAVYFGGGIVGGVVAGLLLPLAKWETGAALVGFLAALPAYFGVAWAIKGPPSHWHGQDIMIAVICAAIMGGGLGCWAWRDHRRSRIREKFGVEATDKGE